MNKKIIIIFIAIILPFLGFAAFLLLQKTPPVQPLNSYSVAINEKNKAYTASLTSENKTTQLDQTTISQYAIVSYNSTYEVMWVLCPETYKITEATSKTQNNINFDQGLSASMSVLPDKDNNITITCAK